MGFIKYQQLFLKILLKFQAVFLALQSLFGLEEYGHLRLHFFFFFFTISFCKSWILVLHLILSIVLSVAPEITAKIDAFNILPEQLSNMEV